MKVLIADDDPTARRILQSFLTKSGHEVTATPDGEAAWLAFEAGEYPLVLTDWMMPGVDGPALIRLIRSDPRQGFVYIILLTALNQKDDLVFGMAAGADDYVTKPFDRRELRARVRQGERMVDLERSLAARNQALREAQAALVQREKLASLGQLAAGVAHEINNPVAYVSNNLTVLKRDVLAALGLLDSYRSGHPTFERPGLATELTQKETEIDLDDIRETVPLLFEKSLNGLQRVREIVQNLRDFARLDEGEFKDVDLNTAIISIVEILRYELKQRRVELRTVFGNVPVIQCHPGKVNQVFLNVLLNAVQACTEGGVVEIRTRTLPNGWVEAEVEDNGCGIKPDHLPKIFEPFFTTKPVGQGTGLGLSVSYGIVRDHGGAIEAESEPGHGTTFRIRFPHQPPTHKRTDDERGMMDEGSTPSASWSSSHRA